jgi:hypothetical protein
MATSFYSQNLAAGTGILPFTLTSTNPEFGEFASGIPACTARKVYRDQMFAVGSANYGTRMISMRTGHERNPLYDIQINKILSAFIIHIGQPRILSNFGPKIVVIKLSGYFEARHFSKMCSILELLFLCSTFLRPIPFKIAQNLIGLLIAVITFRILSRKHGFDIPRVLMK